MAWPTRAAWTGRCGPRTCDETERPGLLHFANGRGRTAYFPWPVDHLFFDHSLPEHRALLAQAVARVAGGRQVVSSAPPQVEIVLSRRPSGESVLRLINHSGHQDRSFHDPLPIFNIELSLALQGDRPTRARALVAGEALSLTTRGERTCLTVPRLDGFEVVLLS